MIYIQRAEANIAEWQAGLLESEEGRTRDEGVFWGAPFLTTRSAVTACLRKADELTASIIN